MKDLYISMGSEIHVRNFGSQNFSFRKIAAEEVKTIIQSTLESDFQVKGYFEFGSVPSKKKDQEFLEILSVFQKIVDMEIDNKTFFHEDSEDATKFFPNFNFISTVDDKTRMLVVEYYFSLDSEKFFASEEDKGFSVSDSSMDFYLFEAL